MKQVQRSRMAMPCLILALLTLVGCGGEPTTQSGGGNYQVKETGKAAGNQDTEVIRLNNCGGKADASQVAERSSTTEIQGGAQLGVGTGVVEAAVNGSYTTGASRTKSITLTAPPDTNMEFTLHWSLEEHIGQVTGEGINGAVTYRYLLPLAVEIAAQRDQGCGQAGQVAQSNPPTETPPPPAQPTAVPPPPPAPPTEAPRQPTASATLAPPTAVPDTPPGTVLEVGQIWRQGGIELQVREVAYNLPGDWGGSGIRIDPFWLTNSRSQQVIITWSTENFTAVDNRGRTLPGGWGCFTCNEIFQPYGSQSKRFESGETGRLASIGFKVNVTDPALTELIVSASGISSIAKARWRVPINH